MTESWESARPGSTYLFICLKWQESLPERHTVLPTVPPRREMAPMVPPRREVRCNCGENRHVNNPPRRSARLPFILRQHNPSPLRCSACIQALLLLARPWCCTSCRVSLSIIINRYNTKEDLAARHWHGKTATTYRNTTKNNQNNLLHKKGMMIDRSRVDNARQRCDAVLHCITHSTRTSFISPTALSGLPVVIWRGAKIPCTIYYYIIYMHTSS